MQLPKNVHNMWRAGAGIDIEILRARCESFGPQLVEQKGQIMTIKRLAFCFASLLVFSAVQVGSANADMLGDIKTGARKAGNAIERGARNVGRAMERTGRALHRGFCDALTDKSDAQCAAESGVGYDKRGTYTYDPNDPSRKYRGDETDPNATDRDRHLSKFAEYVKNKELTASEYEDRDVHHFRRFLLPNARLGMGFPEKEKLVAPTKTGEVRPCCLKGGGGSFLNDRLDKGKLRFYGGTDYLTKPGDPIYATLDGWVEGRKDPRKEFGGVILRNKEGYRSIIYFVELSPDIDAALKAKKRYEVKAGETVIGKAQDLHPVYPPEVANHVFVVMSDPKGSPIDPSGKILLDRAPKSVPEKTPETAAKP